ncbi:MAG: Bacteriophage repressor helix-turn-helix domain protein [Bacteroidetes bacterium]|nr:Bacteriophage repressor helix-turn-helix domain protein [Bacteroidota bacterium]
MKEKDLLFNASDILRRAKLAMGFKTDAELASFLGVSRPTLSNWCARNSIDFALLLSRLQEVNYNWLLTGKGNPVRQPNFCDSELASGEVEVFHNTKTTERLDERSVTLYDISAAANLRTMLESRSQYALGKILIPNMPQCDGAVYVSGDSMYPVLKSGDIIGFKFISDFSNVIYGEIYLVSFERGDEEYLSVKYINRSEIEGCLKLVSYNTHHEPMDLPFQAIHAMGIVKFTIRKNMMM